MNSKDIDVVNDFFKTHIFGWMYSDIRTAIRGKANFLAALALSEYTEIMGGLKTGYLHTIGKARDNYEKFLYYLGTPYQDLAHARS